jgi:hypothetical protein
LWRDEWVDDLCALGRGEAREGKKPDGDLVAVPPDDFAGCFQTVELDNKFKRIRSADRAGNAQPRSSVGYVAHCAR